MLIVAEKGVGGGGRGHREDKWWWRKIKWNKIFLFLKCNIKWKKKVIIENVKFQETFIPLIQGEEKACLNIKYN